MKVKAIVFFLLLGVYGVSYSQGPGKAEQIIADYIEIIGGQKALERIGTLSYDYEMSHLLEGKVTHKKVFKKRPDWVRRGDEGAKGLGISQGRIHWFQRYDKKTDTWQWMKLPEIEMENTYVLGIFGPFIDYKKRGYTLSYVKLMEKNGRETHELRMQKTDGPDIFIYFDKISGRYVGLKSQHQPMTTVRNYVQIGEYLIPTVSEFKGESRGRMVHHINTKRNIRINPKIEDSLFAFPAGE